MYIYVYIYIYICIHTSIQLSMRTCVILEQAAMPIFRTVPTLTDDPRRDSHLNNASSASKALRVKACASSTAERPSCKAWGSR